MRQMRRSGALYRICMADVLGNEEVPSKLTCLSIDGSSSFFLRRPPVEFCGVASSGALWEKEFHLLNVAQNNVLRRIAGGGRAPEQD